MLKRLVAGAVVAVMLAGAVAAGPLEDGFAAYDRGDYATALRLFRPLAVQGDTHAQVNLGGMYYDGRGVPQDYAEAVKWYRLAAEQGFASAQLNLGASYGNGEGVPQDYVLAHLWSNLAAAQGAQTARKNRDSFADLMTPDQLAEAQRLRRLRTSAHQR